MTGRIPRKAAQLAAAILVATAFSALASGVASAKVLYNNIPKTLPANFASIGFEATSTSEFGGQVELLHPSAKHAESLAVSAVMSSWACQSGSWSTDNCETTPGATFEWPITLKLYNVGAGDEPGALIGEETQEFAIPYR